MAKCNQLTLLP